MNKLSHQIDGICAIIVGFLSIAYAVFYLLVSRSAPVLGMAVSWIVLAASGLFSSAVYVALHEELKEINGGFALWSVLLGVAASMATLVHGGYEAILMNSGTAVAQAPSQVDPGGLMTFFVTGLVVFVFSYLMVHSRVFPRGLGTLGMVNAVVLVILFIATVSQVQTLILVSGGLTSVILGPIWWIWLGRWLLRLPGTS